ncbi:MAG TPA: hypothetical protein VHC22_28925 [Pirellulales bacterium]|nr:hypothetical protein [Pirellulales bacterium]
MGTWGVGIFSDDLAADLRSEFRDLIGEGCSPRAAVDRLWDGYASSLDQDDRSVFWLALAAVQWKMGRLEARTKREALRAIENGSDLSRWDDARLKRRRATVLEKLRKQLHSPQPAAKVVRRRIKEANEWPVGEVVAFHLRSGKWTLMRVIGHHVDDGGRFAVCELLKWIGKEIPSRERILKLPVRYGRGAHGVRQFLFQQPRKKQDRPRVLALGIVSSPSQECGGYNGLIWPFVDQLFAEFFGLR